MSFVVHILPHEGPGVQMEVDRLPSVNDIVLKCMRDAGWTCDDVVHETEEGVSYRVFLPPTEGIK